MATTVRSLFFAATAAVFMTLSACGGGEESSVQAPTSVLTSQDAAAKAFSGPAVPASQKGVNPFDQKRRALSASATQKFSLTASFRTASVQTEQKALAATAEKSQVDKLYDWAEGLYPELFPSHQETKNVCIPQGCFEYRYYPETNNYVGVKDGRIWLYGAYTGDQLVEYVTVDSLKCSFDVDSCRPYVQTFAPVKDATNVAKGTAAVFTYNEALNCSGVGGTTEVGEEGSLKITVELSCNATAKTVTVKPVTQWPYNSQACLTLAGIHNLAGYGSLPEKLCFTTERLAVPAAGKFYVANATHESAGAKAAAVLDVASGGITPIAFPPVPGFGSVHAVAIDPLMGRAYFATFGTFRLYSIDLQTHKVFEPIAIDPDFTYIYAIHGVATTETEVCMTFGWYDAPSHPRHNQLDCRSLSNQAETWKSATNFLADNTRTVTALRYLPYGTAKNLYALAGSNSAYFGEVYDPTNGAIRHGYGPGTVGTVVEVDAVTHAKLRSWNVGSVPQGIDRATNGDLYVTNSGDASMSIIRYATGQVETISLASSFVGYQRPLYIKIDQPRDRFYVTDYLGAVIAFRLSDHKEVARLPVGVLTIDLAMSGGKLAVTSMEGTVVVIDLDTFTVVKKFTGVGNNTYGIAGLQ